MGTQLGTDVKGYGSEVLLSADNKSLQFNEQGLEDYSNTRKLKL